LSLGYNFKLAVLAIRHSRGTAFQAILAISLGVAALSATGGALYSLMGGPAQNEGGQLLHPQLDPRPLDGDHDQPLPDGLTLHDARAIFDRSPSGHRFMTTHSWLPMVGSGIGGAAARMISVRPTTRDFFSEMGAQFTYGNAWSAQEEGARAQMIVLSDRANQELFGGVDSRGKVLTLATRAFQVVGILKAWSVTPKFYDLGAGAYGAEEYLYIPFDSWLELPQDYGYGSMECFGKTENDHHNPNSDRCSWVQLWVAVTPGAVGAYRVMLTSYAQRQKERGRYERDAAVDLQSSSQWLKTKRAIPETVRIQFWVALGLFVTCLVNAITLQLVRFRARLRELGLRRALGASRSDTLQLLLLESTLIGLGGGLVGIGLGYLALRVLQLNPASYASHIAMDPVFALASVGAAILSCVIASLYPALDVVCRAPVRQLRHG
jgi:putative ABC transport system permease protein